MKPLPTTEKAFQAQIRAVCEAHDVTQFAIYGHYAQVVDGQGKLVPPDRLVWVDGEPIIAQEAAYHFGRIADGKEP